ncbi:MAG: aminodeoxychorismate/anthranilate synthase component II [Thermodesulfobacteriota bacterium]
MIFVLDNYDSFTYNLVQYLLILGAEVKVARNDQIAVSEVLENKPAGIVISPGPKTPQEAGVSVDLIRAAAGRVPVLGVCLGHQSIAVAFGGTVSSAKRLMHGKTSQVTSDGLGVYAGIANPFTAMRYHSLAVIESDLPECLVVSSRADDGEIMGIRHKEFPVEGIQFHPESIMTQVGKRLMRNFLKICGQA